jgi:hypothetical protein
MADGVVRQVKEWGTKGSLGWGVQVYYPAIDTMKLDLHLAKILVKVGQQVKQCQPIAMVGVGKNQTIVEHTHEQYEKGNRLSTGLMGNYTQNPYSYTKDMKLITEIQHPTPPIEPPPVEETVCIPESVWKAMLTKSEEDDRTIAALNSLLTMCKKEKDALNQTVLDIQGQRDVYEKDIQNISAILGVKYEYGMDWDIQKFKYEGALAIIKNDVLKNATIKELVGAILDKFKKTP